MVLLLLLLSALQCNFLIFVPWVTHSLPNLTQVLHDSVRLPQLILLISCNFSPRRLSLKKMSSARDESASASSSHKSPKFSRPSASTGVHQATIPESPENENNEDDGGGTTSPPLAAVPPQVPRRNRAMSSAHLSHFLGSTASAARRSLALRPAPPMPTVTPQFLTVSPAFSVRDQSRSPSPARPPLLSPLRSGARHSIDVRNFPSYLQRKRTSLTLGAGKILHDLSEAASSPFSPSSPEHLKPLNEPFYEEPEAPVLSLGERVAWIVGGGLPEFGVVKWIGRMPQVCRTWTVGVEFDNAIGSGDGRWEGRRYFTAKENFAKFLPLVALTRVDHYAGRPRSGTLLSRMSVQLKPGQLISVQRTPSIHHLAHCVLNAPHHVDHDVHAPNMEHCLCHNCNHPCAHLCKTARPKGKKGKKDVQIAHMCHFSHKPHGKLCCGGEDLLYESITSPKTSIPADTRCGDTYYDRRLSEDHSSCSKGRCKASKSETREKRRKKSTSSSRRSSSLPAQIESLDPQCAEQTLQSELQQQQPQSTDSVVPEEGSVMGHEEQETRSRSSSELSVSSLPCTSRPDSCHSSPVDVYIARGALTDEESVDVELDLVHSIAARTPSEISSVERGRVSGGLRSLVSCLVPGISYQKTNSTRSRHRKRAHKYVPQEGHSKQQICTAVSMEFTDNFKDHHFHGSVFSTRSNSRSCKYKGLSTSPEDLDTGRNSSANSRGQTVSPRNSSSNNNRNIESNHNQINAFLLSDDNFIVSCAHKDDSLSQIAPKSPASTMTGSPDCAKESAIRESSPVQDHRDSGVWSKVSTAASILQVDLDVIAESDLWMNEERNKSTGGTSPSCHDQDDGGSEPCSTMGKCRSRRKGRAPRPPAVPLCSNSATNSPLFSFASASFSPTCRKRKSLKTRPAPSPPPADMGTLLVRSLSEQRQLNVKNRLNAVPSFRSAVDLKAVPRAQQSADTIATEEGDTLYVSFEEDDTVGQRVSSHCDCCDVVSGPAVVVMGDEFLSPPLSPPLSLPLPPPPSEHVDYFDDRGWHRDASVQVSGFPSPPSEYFGDQGKEESGDEEEDDDYVDDEETDDEEDSSADVTVNYESDDLVGHSHSVAVCRACGCHLFRNGVPALSSCPSACKYNNNNRNHADDNMKDGVRNQQQNQAEKRLLYRESGGMSEETGQLLPDCPSSVSSCRWRNSYRRTFSVQFPVGEECRGDPAAAAPAAASDPSGRQDRADGRTSDAERCCGDNGFSDQNSLPFPPEIDLATVSLNLKALLSPHRDWIRCSMCRTEVCCWLAASTTVGLNAAKNREQKNASPSCTDAATHGHACHRKC